ncbi:MAG: sigma factor-like helix-turn-helix DNA-binding protein, partial [Thermoguttaceae bacterium]|nr:sigma factor-like helix-turn-helix DNA-binding protein [Thermoguttaceae bacterium]
SRGERVCVADPEDAIRKKEFWNAVAEPLSESERRLLRLLYECWQTYRQAGKTLGISGSTVGHTHAQILQRLRTKFSYEQLREIVLDVP